ncbi:2'-5'-oligoadenylate synthase 1A-like [Talpa occidentalis]|uniref:2'-5'-oligoadenylate synthase 1A-like n=1 Tax=Talpa occidentalis TaxID=50954 RepID=UPI00188E7F0B|nr:2'-5'-oligoadenylate synthase 1A-like [Talpa occidentalis]
MCSRHFGTVLGREKHEIQEHHFTASKRAQMSTGFSPYNMLECKSSQELQRFADEKIRPSSGPLSAACAAEVIALLELIQACFPLPTSRVIQGGSFIKGTDTQECSEIDVVLFSDVFANVKLCKKQLKESLDALRKNLKQTSHGNSGNLHSHSFEVMTYYDILGPTPSTEVPAFILYDKLKGRYYLWVEVLNIRKENLRKFKPTDLKLHLYRKLYLCDDSDEAQLCALALLPYQVDFVKASVMRVKELIRLMIHWFRTSFAKTTEENKYVPETSPTYTVELLSIHVWELAGKPLFFSLVQGMRAILKLLVQYAEIDVVWHRHYHPKFPIFVKVNRKHTRPFILDPVNPTANMCDSCNAWDEVAHVARCSLEKPLFSRVRVMAPWLFTDNW